MKKNSFTKRITVGTAILLGLILTFTACKTPVAPVDASPAPTEQPSEAPVSPTDVPQIPEITPIDFFEKGEEVARFIPGDGEYDVNYAYEGTDYFSDAPGNFCVSGRKIYIRDYYDPDMLSSLLVYDMASMETDRLKDHPAEDDKYAPFAVFDGMVIKNHSYFDIEADSINDLISDFNSANIYSIGTVGEKVIRIAFSTTNNLYKSEFDNEKGLWSEKELIGNVVVDSHAGATYWHFLNGNVSFAVPNLLRYIGDDLAGGHYYLGEYIMKYDAAGMLVSAAELPFKWEELYVNSMDVVLGDDGFVYIMACYPEYTVVYRIML